MASSVRRRSAAVALLAAAALLPPPSPAAAGAADPVPPPGPVMTDGRLVVEPVVTGLSRPASMAFLPDGSFFVLEKGVGVVHHVVDGRAVPVLDLPVNSNALAQNAERGLLGIALSPHFARDGAVFLYWTQSDAPPADTPLPAQAPLLANRIDRFSWDGTTLVHEANLVMLRARRDDLGPGPLETAGHVGGVLRFGPDGMLYAVIGDVGRRSQMQNLACGPTTACPGPAVPDDRYGGPEPDDAHLTGVVLRLAPDGTAPRDNPFWAYGRNLGGEVGENLQRVFAYGVRNSFGLAFDPVSGALWDQENAEDGYDEINRVDPGFNSGWVQLMGPRDRYQDWRHLETVVYPAGAGEVRYPTSSMAPTVEEALARLVVLPGSHYSDPEFSWRHPFPPAGMGFVGSRALGRRYEHDLVVGNVRGGLWRFELTGNRRRIAVDDPRLADRVADNAARGDLTESESLLWGSGFGIVTDVQTAPDGTLHLVYHGLGAVYRVSRR